jgi:hypothetical protein
LGSAHAFAIAASGPKTKCRHHEAIIADLQAWVEDLRESRDHWLELALNAERKGPKPQGAEPESVPSQSAPSRFAHSLARSTAGRYFFAMKVAPRLARYCRAYSSHERAKLLDLGPELGVGAGSRLALALDGPGLGLPPQNPL